MTRIEDIMSRDVVTVDSGTTTSHALLLAKKCQVHHLLVTQASTLKGVLCTCDLWPAIASDPVAHVMRRPQATIAPGAPLPDAAHLMREHHVGCLPVLEDGAVVGVVTRGDLRGQGFDHTQDLGGEYCECCGASSHVRPHIRMEGIFLCASCQMRASPPGINEDIGSGD